MSAHDLSYREQRDKLADRIRAHKQFANFDVADWIEEALQRAYPEIVDVVVHLEPA